MITAYPAGGTRPDTFHALLLATRGIQIAYTAVDAVQCDNCGEHGAIVEARIYATDAGLYTECCLPCAPVVVAFYLEQQDTDVLVEINAEVQL